jgi:hypothetical protein
MTDEQTNPTDERAAADLEFIRTTMARSASFTAVPGYGGVLMGGIALVAAWVSSLQPTRGAWLIVWLTAAGVAGAIAVEAIRRKSNRAGIPFWSASARRFAQGLLPSLAAGAALTAAAMAGGHDDLLPAIWLLLYGAGVVAGASASIPLLTGLGIAFMAVGVVALMLPAVLGTLCLATGFGGLNVAFGILIARKHGG